MSNVGSKRFSAMPESPSHGEDVGLLRSSQEASQHLNWAGSPRVHNCHN